MSNTNHANELIGKRVRATHMAADSFYLQVEGVATGIRNGFVQITADRVMDRWSKQWEPHPTSCATAARVENVVTV